MAVAAKRVADYDFVGFEQVAGGKMRFFRVPLAHPRGAPDAGQQPAVEGRGEPALPFAEKDIRDRPLGEFALLIEEEHLVPTGLAGGVKARVVELPASGFVIEKYIGRIRPLS